MIEAFAVSFPVLPYREIRRIREPKAKSPIFTIIPAKLPVFPLALPLALRQDRSRFSGERRPTLHHQSGPSRVRLRLSHGIGGNRGGSGPGSDVLEEGHDPLVRGGQLAGLRPGGEAGADRVEVQLVDVV